MIATIHEELLKLLLSFDAFCKQEGILYYLAYGTLLGAVRHSGFIPWDDDVDILMPLGDYEKLLAACERLPHGYMIQTMEDDKKYFFAFAKYRFKGCSSPLEADDILYGRRAGGAFLDLFPLIPVSGKDRKGKRWYQKRRFLSRLLALKAIPFAKANAKRKILKPLSWLISRRAVVHMQNALAHRWRDTPTNFYYIQDVNSAFEDNVFSKDLFGEPIFMQFESHSFPCPRHTKDLLVSWYGDYWELPPENQRQHHLLFE